MRLVRVVRISRRRLRLGNVNISNLTSGTLVDLDSPQVLRDIRQNWDNLAVLPPYSMAGGATSGADNLPLLDVGADLTALTTGNIRYVPIELPLGAKVSAATFVSGATALATGTHQWAALFSADSQTAPATLTVQAVSADGTNTAWAAESAKTFSFATAYTVPTAGFYWVGLLVAATTVPTLAGATVRKGVWSLTNNPTLTRRQVLETGQSRTTPLAVAATVTTTFTSPTPDTVVPFLRLT